MYTSLLRIYEYIKTAVSHFSKLMLEFIKKKYFTQMNKSYGKYVINNCYQDQ